MWAGLTVCWESASGIGRVGSGVPSKACQTNSVSDLDLWGRTQHKKDGAHLLAVLEEGPTQGKLELPFSPCPKPHNSVCSLYASNTFLDTVPLLEPRVSACK